ncbi:MAG: carbohydrate kinase family protein [Verrucomicrobiota bacterium JB024]|nr:carbohydrate kinase family protein [Verrucomicrobiota bacterium JB024]
MTRNGILCAGNWIIDHVKVLDAWPHQDGLATITEQSDGNGGCPYNVAKDLARLHPGLPLYASGLLGDDADGRAIIADCQEHGIDSARLQLTAEAPTSYTDVMTDRSTGRRTFFHQRGTNALLGAEHIRLDDCPARLFVMGYFGLLDTLDAVGPDGSNGHAKVFARASELGMLTCADLVSTPCDFPAIVGPSLPHLDLLVLNEWEAAELTGIPNGDNGEVDIAALQNQARMLLGRGVRRAVAIHFREGAVIVTASGETHLQGSVKFSSERIRGAAGAGDAFFAGLLYGLHEGWSWSDCARLAVCTATASLEAPTCSDAVRPWRECLALGDEFSFETL